MDVEKKIRTNGEQENDCWEKRHLKLQKWIHKLFVACSAITDQERATLSQLLPCNTGGIRGTSFSIAAYGNRGCQSHLFPGGVNTQKEKLCSQKQSAL